MAERGTTARAAIPVALVLVVAAVAALLVADPFGDDEDAEQEITAAIERAATSTDPDYCADSVTQAYLEQRSGFRGRAALADCQDLAGETSAIPDEVTVEAIEIEDSTASAQVRHDGGAFDGALVGLELVEDDGWRLDRLETIQDLDPRTYERFYREQLLAPPFEFEPVAAACMAERLWALPAAELEAALINYDPESVTRAAVACDRASVERLIASTFATASYGLEPAELQCAVGAIRVMSDEDLASLYAEPGTQRTLLEGCTQGG